MKFTDLSPAKQQLLKAFVEGEAIQIYYPHTGWIDALDRTIWAIDQFPADRLQVKPKEPVVTCRFNAIGLDGHLYSAVDSTSVKNLKEYYSGSKLHSFVKRTFHDGMFIKTEIVQE